MLGKRAKQPISGNAFGLWANREIRKHQALKWRDPKTYHFLRLTTVPSFLSARAEWNATLRLSCDKIMSGTRRGHNSYLHSTEDTTVLIINLNFSVRFASAEQHMIRLHSLQDRGSNFVCSKCMIYYFYPPRIDRDHEYIYEYRWMTAFLQKPLTLCNIRDVLLVEIFAEMCETDTVNLSKRKKELDFRLWLLFCMMPNHNTNLPLMENACPTFWIFE